MQQHAPENKEDRRSGLAPLLRLGGRLARRSLPNRKFGFAVVLYGGVAVAIEYAGVSSGLNDRKQSGREDIQRILSNSGVRRREENENVVP
jgi:hypothetical protein